MQAFEYSLNLSTGEKIDVLEIPLKALDSWSKRAFQDPIAFKSMSGILSLCTTATHQAMEDAKIGYTKPLERLLKTPPIGILIKLDRPVCMSISDCAMADRKKCTTKFDKFPECWDYALDVEGDFTEVVTIAHEIVKQIVMAWRDGRYVIIVS